ncbi:MAG TPA: Gfo/Idh/MocA family oxidoreductase [Planctomycetota bacterium]|nr:Gfo/Idh/MocA family oxidoreductase [Planctomycetota bacterium]
MSKKIGVIGCGGRIRSILKRLPGLGQDLIITAICDPSEASRRKTMEAFAPAARVCSDYRELVAAPDVDWVMVGSWNCHHREHAIAALAAGKHVFCEKPLATTLEDCLAIRDAWRASDRTFCLGFVLRYSPHYQKIREILMSGALGRIVSMEFNETLHYEHGGYIHGDWRRRTEWAGSHLLEKCCHDLDLILWLTGGLPLRAASFGGVSFFRPENAGYVEKLGAHPKGQPAFSSWADFAVTPYVNPFTAEKDIVDNQVAIMEFAGGVRATFHTNCSTNLPERRMYICGTEGTLRADVLAGSIEYRRIGHQEELIRPETGARGGHGGADETLCRSLRACMLEGAAPLADPEDGVRSAITAFGIDQAMAEGRVVDLSPMWARAGIDPWKRERPAPDRELAVAAG